ncbi:MAG: hypothetical protein FJ295_14595 [Planctomycetes bacterium]|nr:hypothetical protein [Planctomycetota bacterium]
MPDRGSWQPRFTMKTMFLVVLIVCVMSAGGSYLARSIRVGARSPLVFFLFIVVAPAFVLIVVNIGLRLFDRFRRP